MGEIYLRGKPVMGLTKSRVYVVAFAPARGTDGVGGLEWRWEQDQAFGYFRKHLAEFPSDRLYLTVADVDLEGADPDVITEQLDVMMGEGQLVPFVVQHDLAVLTDAPEFSEVAL